MFPIFITVTDGDTKRRLNVDHIITYAHHYTGKGTLLIGSDQETMANESPEEIDQMIREAVDNKVMFLADLMR